MERLMRFCFVALTLLVLTGCVSICVENERNATVWPTSTQTRIVHAEVTGVQPLVERKGDVFNIDVRLLGTFEMETRTTSRGVPGKAGYMSVGFFPGVMSCKGEYGDCVQNALGASFYNLVFVGLPTVYGLFVEPFVPHYPEQTDSIVGKSAFLKSTLIGFSRYSKIGKAPERTHVARSEARSVSLENAFISAPGLSLVSRRNESLHIPLDMLPEDGEVWIKLALPAGHPLKPALAGFEDAEIMVRCEIGKEN